MRKVFYGLSLCVLFAVGARAQAVEGDWQGTHKVGEAELRLVLHVSKDEKGALRATLDSPDQNAKGIPVTSISLSDSTLKIELQQIGGSYEGKVNAERTVVSGTWTQGGQSLPLEFTKATTRREERKKVPKPSDVDGVWEGTLDAGTNKLRLVLHIATYEDGMTATVDSPDQNVAGLPVTTITRDGARLKFAMKQIAGSFEGTIGEGLKTISGTWSQGGTSVPLVLNRQGEPPKEKKPGGGV